MKLRSILPVAFALSASFPSLAANDPVDRVNPFIGTGGNGHCFPAAAYPFGLVQADPDTGWGTWDYCSGYRYEDSQITMFSQTHNPGGGCPDYADVGIMPFTGDATNVVATFSHANETATPGYYAAFDFSKTYVGCSYTARLNAALSVPAALAPKEPVLVDLLRGGVYAIGNVRRDGGTVVFEGLPLVDYPLAIAERSVLPSSPTKSQEESNERHITNLKSEETI